MDEGKKEIGRDFILFSQNKSHRKVRKLKIHLHFLDIHNGLGFTSRYPNVIQAIERQKFQKMAGISTIEKVAPPTVESGLSSTVCWNMTIE